jgi:dTDP-4-amino-4,6-dideoxygalactose transaminase
MKKSFIPVSRPLIGWRERVAVDRVLKSGSLAQGAEVENFETEFSQVVGGGRTAIAVNSGTSGLHLGLLAAGIGPGDEVIVPSFTFAATANAVALTGATPVFADISPESFCLNPDSVADCINPRTAAIMPVHLYGHPAPMQELTKLANRHGLALIEDAAQAHLAQLHGQKVGTFGLMAVFSMYPTKNMTSGEGGVVLCSDDGIERKIRLLRNQGMIRPYENEVVGFNNRMTDIHAAIGREQLKRLEKWTKTRQDNARFLSQEINIGVTPVQAHGASHVYHQYTLRLPGNRDRFRELMKEQFAIGTGLYYPTPSHMLPSLARFALNADLPATLKASREVVSLPVGPSLSRGDLQRIANAVRLVGEAL